MFTTSMTAAVIAGLFASGSLASQPDWTESYGKAMVQAGEKQRPVAVFLSAGELTKLTNGKVLASDALKSLKSNFIPVKVDTTTEEGKQLATAFGMTQGVVISDRSGKLVALRHEGEVTPEQVSEYLTKFEKVETVVNTEHRSSVAVQYQQTQYQQPQYYQQPRPVMNAIQNFGGMVTSPFVGGS